jgi:hypothetical protein
MFATRISACDKNDGDDDCDCDCDSMDSNRLPPTRLSGRADVEVEVEVEVVGGDDCSY